jgi:hypothetical protein
MLEIEDILESPEKAPLLLGWEWVLVIIICLIILCAIFAYIKFRKNATASIDHLKKALKRLRNIEQSVTQNNFDNNQISIELSLITREYLQGQFRNKSIFQTHQEFITDHEDLNKIPETARENLSSYLTTLANHKYSPDRQLPAEINKLIQLTESLLKGIHTASHENNSKKS